MKRQFAIFGLLIALGVSFAGAQSPARTPAGPEEGNLKEEPQTAGKGTVQVDPESAAPGTPDSVTEATTEPETAGSDDSPFDYQASEQISEDLSVSFPVDI